MASATTTNDATELRPDDVLGAILAIASEQGAEGAHRRFAFRGHDSDLQALFFDLVREFRDPLTDRFIFSEKGPLPYSPILSDAISKLQLCGFIGRENPDYEILSVKPAAVEYFNTVLRDNLSPRQLHVLKEVAGKFKNKVTRVPSA